MTDSLESRVAGMFDEDFSSGKRLFFLQGFWRSGTSWVGRMLHQHPAVDVCQYELQSYMRELAITQFGEPLELHPFLSGRLALARKAGFLSILQQVHRSSKPRASIVGERSPGGDVVALKRDFPQSKLIVIVRDGRDVCVSAAFLERMALGRHRCFEDETSERLSRAFIEQMAGLYVGYMDSYYALHQAHPRDVLLITYESLQADTAAGLAAMFQFLEVDVDRTTLAAICRDHSFLAESQRRPGQEDGKSLMRKGVVGDWKHHFSPEGAALFDRIAGVVLERAGYDRRTDTGRVSG